MNIILLAYDIVVIVSSCRGFMWFTRGIEIQTGIVSENLLIYFSQTLADRDGTIDTRTDLADSSHKAWV